ncbi:hypothetical protein HPB49_016631 [Dermacentor silvarum]|uniref:Uncharacterized protein n=1 Tax=Dermacentor silvarum TaxID=543639 RepID=A0ACB8DJZ5_DERSI|nr:hypothetical protein HPB49_016631 [Dermacentor silvarum]
MTHLNEKALLEMAAKLEMKADKLESYDHLVSEVKEAMGQWAQRARGRRGLKPWWSREVAEAIQCRQQKSNPQISQLTLRGSPDGEEVIGEKSISLLQEWLQSLQRQDAPDTLSEDMAGSYMLLTPEEQADADLQLALTEREFQRAVSRVDVGTAAGCEGTPMGLIKALGPKAQARVEEFVAKALGSAKALMLSVDEARQLEQTSRQQSQSATWKAARKNRLTASNFGVAVTRENWTQKGLQNLTTDRDLSRVRAIQYGVSSEAMAVQQYERTLRTFRHNIETFHCGLIVDPTCPWLGASPDRVVWDPEEQSPHGIVEVKCP